MTLMIEGFLLGLAMGVSCVVSCAPIVLPYLIGEGRSLRGNATAVVQFLGGRMAGYLVFAAFAWKFGQLVRASQWNGLVFGVVFLILAAILAAYGFSAPQTCAAGGLRRRRHGIASRWPSLLPFFMGLLTGLSLCPPFLTAIARATNQGTLLATLLFFLAFFVATSLYLLPFPFAGMLGRSPAFRMIGRLAAGLMGVFYLYKGMIMIYGGLRA